MILNAISEKLKRQSKDDFKGRHFEAWLIMQAVAWYKIIETSSLDTREGDGDQANQIIGIRASFDIDNDGLLRLLHGLEAGLPLIFVDKLSIRHQAGNTEGPDLLRVDIEASARWKAVTS